MLIDLDKEDLINLVRGIYPNFNVMNDFYIKDKGIYNYNRGRWIWNIFKLKESDEHDLLNIYYICKNSWK